MEGPDSISMISSFAFSLSKRSLARRICFKAFRTSFNQESGLFHKRLSQANILAQIRTLLAFFGNQHRFKGVSFDSETPEERWWALFMTYMLLGGSGYPHQPTAHKLRDIFNDFPGQSLSGSKR